MTKRAAALVALTVLLACAAAPDEAWMRITELRTSDGRSSLSVVESKLRDGENDYIDVYVQNFTAIVGSTTGSGVGIELYNARVEYDLGGYRLPPFEFPLALYLPPPESAGGGTAQVVENLPVVTVELKGWFLDPANFPRESLGQPVRLQARVILKARTEEGRNLETSAAVAVVLDTSR